MIVEILSITFFSGMMSIFIILLLLMGALLLIGKNPFKGFSLTALVTTNPLAAKLQPYGATTGWKYRPFAQKGKTIIGREGMEKQVPISRVTLFKGKGITIGQPVGQGAKTISAAKRGISYLIHRRSNIQRRKDLASFFSEGINKVYNISKQVSGQARYITKYTKAGKSLPTLAPYVAYKQYLNLSTLFADDFLKVEKFVKGPLREGSTLKFQSEWKGGLPKNEKEKLEKLTDENKKFVKDFNLVDLAKSYGVEAQKTGNTVEAFAKIVGFSERLGVDLKTSFLAGVYAETFRQTLAKGKDPKTAKEEAREMVLDTVRGYNKFIDEMRGGRAPSVLDGIKKLTGARVIFDLRFASIDMKKDIKEEDIKNILSEVENDRLGSVKYKATKLEELMKAVSYHAIIDTKERNEQIAKSVKQQTNLRKPKEAIENWFKKTRFFSEEPIEFSYLVMLKGLPPSQTTKKTTK